MSSKSNSVSSDWDYREADRLIDIDSILAQTGKKRKSDITMLQAYESDFSKNDGQRLDAAGHLLSILMKYFNNDELSDVTLTLKEHSYPAHRFILCAQSAVFAIMLTDVRWTDQRHSTLQLIEEEECHGVFEVFLNFFYTGTVSLNHDTVLPILMLADKYQVDSLQLLCLNYMISHKAATLHHKQIFTWYRYLDTVGYKIAAQNLWYFIQCNFCDLVDSDDFYSCDFDFLLTLVKTSRLVVPSEYKLLLIIVDWVKEQDNFQENISSLTEEQVHKLFAHIRFPMMTLEELCKVHDLDIVQKNQDFFVKLIKLAMKFHSNGYENCLRKYSAENHQHMIEPRPYTEPSLSKKLDILYYKDLEELSIRKFYFTFPLSNSEADQNVKLEWSMEIYPKGIEFGRFMMIALFRRIHIDSCIEKVFRFILQPKSDPPPPYYGYKLKKIQIGIYLVVYAEEDGIEIVRKVERRVVTFEGENAIHHFDDILDYEEVNDNPNSEYLIKNDSLKFRLSLNVIKRVY